MPAPPGQLGKATKARGGVAQETPKPKPKPQTPSGPSGAGDLLAELAARQQSGGSGNVNSPPQQKPQHEVNTTNLGVQLKSVPMSERPKPLQPPVSSNSSGTKSFSPSSTKVVEPNLSWRLEGPEECTTEVEVEFKLTCKNSETKASFDFNPRNIESQVWPLGKDSQTTEAKILRSNAGLYVLQFGYLRQGGDYLLNIWTISQDGSRRAIYQKPCPLYVDSGDFLEEVGEDMTIRASGAGFKGGEAGRPAVFQIKARDANGRPVELNIQKLKVWLFQPGKKLPATVTEIANGDYQATYTPQQDGEWKCEVCYGETTVAESTMVFTGKTEGNKTVVTKYPRQVRVNENATFTLQARDRMEQALSSGGETFKTSVAGPATAGSMNMRDNMDGTYTCSFTLVKPGKYEFSVKLRNKDIDGSPLEILCVH